jgi:hypothetical protein
MEHRNREFGRLWSLVTDAVMPDLGFGRRIGAGENLLAFLVAFAFVLQSFLTQTHLHDTAPAFGNGAIINLSTDAPVHKAPADSSPLDCPYCQAVAHSGAFFLPTAPLLGLPAIPGERATLPIIAQVFRSAAALGWRSRAPPPL